MAKRSKKTEESKGENFVLTLPLRVESWQADILDKRYEYLRKIYNFVQGKLLRQYLYFEQTDEYKAINTIKEKKEFFKKKEEFFKKHFFYINGILSSSNDLIPINFTEFGLRRFIRKLNQKKNRT